MSSFQVPIHYHPSIKFITTLLSILLPHHSTKPYLFYYLINYKVISDNSQIVILIIIISLNKMMHSYESDSPSNDGIFLSTFPKKSPTNEQKRTSTSPNKISFRGDCMPQPTIKPNEDPIKAQKAIDHYQHQKLNNAAGKFTCDCTICIEQTRPEYYEEREYQNILDVREYLYQGFNKDFLWLMNHLLPINDKIRGCELIFPDTVLFHRGKPKVIIKNDKEYCLMAVRQPNKLSLQSIYKDFSNVVRERKKDFSGPFQKLYFKNQNVDLMLGINALFGNNNNSYGGQRGDRNRRDQTTGGSGGNSPNPAGQAIAALYGMNSYGGAQNIYYKDVALIRYNDKEESVQVVNETGFMNTFLKRANDDYWKTVSSIQTNVKSRLGCGTPIIIKFYAPIDEEDREAEIKYDFRSVGDDLDLVHAAGKESGQNAGYQYCLKQCYKMCYYVQKIYNFEILKMRAEFTKDENGTIWFMYASQLVVRQIKGKGAHINIKRVNYINQQNKLNLLAELDRHQEQAKENNSQNIQKMYEIMGQHYNMMKEHIGLKDVFDNSDSDGETEKIFNKLRPQSPYKFKDLIRNNFDPKKFNRMIGVNEKKLDQEQIKDMILYNKQTVQSAKKRYDKSNYVELQENARMMHNLIGGQQVPPRSAASQQRSQGGAAYQSHRILSFKNRPMTAGASSQGLKVGGNRLHSAAGSRQKGTFFQISRGNYPFENHRNESSTNISSMRDVQRMYEPPIPKHQIPTNNPFYNKSLVTSTNLNSDSNPMRKSMGALSLGAVNNPIFSQGKSSPRSLLNWINSPNSKRIQQKMNNRIQYLKLLAQHKNAFVSEIATLIDEDQNAQTASQHEVKNKMQKLLMLADDPKGYFHAVEEFKRQEEEFGTKVKEDHLFEDKYIISDRTMFSKHNQ